MKRISKSPDICSAAVVSKRKLKDWTDIVAMTTVLVSEVGGCCYLNEDGGIAFAKVAKFVRIVNNVALKKPQRMLIGLRNRPIFIAFYQAT